MSDAARVLCILEQDLRMARVRLGALLADIYHSPHAGRLLLTLPDECKRLAAATVVLSDLKAQYVADPCTDGLACLLTLIIKYNKEDRIEEAKEAGALLSGGYHQRLLNGRS